MAEPFYHCCLLLEESGGLDMALAWSERGGSLLGFCVAQGSGAPTACAFKASGIGAWDSFLVADGWPATAAWEDDHLRALGGPVAMGAADLAALEALSAAVFEEWLEPFGESQAKAALRMDGRQRASWREAFAGTLPLETRADRRSSLEAMAGPWGMRLRRAWVGNLDRGREASLDARLRKLNELL